LAASSLRLADDVAYFNKGRMPDAARIVQCPDFGQTDRRNAGGLGGGILDALPFGTVTARGPQLWRLMIGF
jgi:hypothetical protein